MYESCRQKPQCCWDLQQLAILHFCTIVWTQLARPLAELVYWCRWSLRLNVSYVLNAWLIRNRVTGISWSHVIIIIQNIFNCSTLGSSFGSHMIGSSYFEALVFNWLIKIVLDLIFIGRIHLAFYLLQERWEKLLALFHTDFVFRTLESEFCLR